ITELFQLSEIPSLKLVQQLEAIEPLEDLQGTGSERILRDNKTYWHLFAYLFKMANHYKKQKKSDITALLTYRCLEMIVQRLLVKKGISPFKPSYDHLDYGELMEKVNKVAKDTF
ncbi:hypothetical protein, partial [Pseudomonas sp. 2995-1]|uniref:hypothetical protein n=1 Tax=Pseudomonas sp. 2995-1 TaxID=1712679 RepID=UPI000C5B4765